jgi:hypothetical protein
MKLVEKRFIKSFLQLLKNRELTKCQAPDLMLICIRIIRHKNPSGKSEHLKEMTK